MARTNHKDFHKKLIEMGYNIYIVDYAQGGHTYQFDKDGKDWNEYHVNTKKKTILASVNNEILLLLKEHYEKQGYTIE